MNYETAPLLQIGQREGERESAKLTLTKQQNEKAQNFSLSVARR